MTGLIELSQLRDRYYLSLGRAGGDAVQRWFDEFFARCPDASTVEIGLNWDLDTDEESYGYQLRVYFPNAFWYVDEDRFDHYGGLTETQLKALRERVAPAVDEFRRYATVFSGVLEDIFGHRVVLRCERESNHEADAKPAG